MLAVTPLRRALNGFNLFMREMAEQGKVMKPSNTIKNRFRIGAKQYNALTDAQRASYAKRAKNAKIQPKGDVPKAFEKLHMKKLEKLPEVKRAATLRKMWREANKSAALRKKMAKVSVKKASNKVKASKKAKPAKKSKKVKPSKKSKKVKVAKKVRKNKK